MSMTMDKETEDMSLCESAEDSISMKSFQEYLAESQILSEDLVAKIKQQWPNSDLLQMLEIAKFSPDYSSAMKNGKLFIGLGSTQEEADAAEKKLVDGVKERFGGEDSLKAYLGTAQIKIEKTSKKQKKSKTEQVETFGVTFSGDIKQLALLYIAIVGEKNVNELQNYLRPIQTIDGTSFYVADLEKLKLVDSFMSSLTVDGDISRSTRWLLNTTYRMATKEKKPYTEIFKEMRESRVALLLKWFTGDLKKLVKDVNLDSVPSVAELKRIVDEASRKQDSPDSLPRDEIDTSSLHPCAARRLQLFEDAKRFGAIVYNNTKWMCAVLTEFKQSAVFGRAKPKVLPDTNQIDQSINKYDGDNDHAGQMTQEQKNRRDSSSVAYVQDGIGFDNQWCETGWCTAGSYQQGNGKWNYQDKNSSFFNDYSQRGQHPLVVIMNLANGKLYQYSPSKHHFLNEADAVEGKARADGATNGDSYLDWLIQQNPDTDLGKLVASGDKVYYAKQYKKLVAEAQVTPDGFLVVTNSQQIKKFQSIFSKFSGLKIGINDASGMFQGLEFTGLPPIDMSMVVDATEMFRDARVGDVNLRNCAPAGMIGMFRDAKVNKVEGLNTKNAISINDMFNGARVNKREDQSYTEIKLSPFMLNLKQCQSMDRAFFDSHIGQVLLEDTDQIATAQGAFAACPFLKSLPDMKFKKLKNCGIGDDLVASNVYFDDQHGNKVNEHSPEEIFAFSPKVASLPNFAEEMESLREFYKPVVDVKDLVDDRGYLVIKNKEMVVKFAKDFNKYPGVKVAMEDASGLFYLQRIYIKNLDLAGVKDAQEMFRGAKVFNLGKIEGTEQLENVKQMFLDARIMQLPDMNCPRATIFDDMFSISRDDSVDSIPPSTLILGSSGFAERDWSDVVDQNYWSTPTITTFLHRVFGDAYSYFKNAFPWELRKMSEAASEHLAEGLQMKLEKDGSITLTSAEAARVLLMNKTLIGKCQKIKIRPPDGIARGWFARITDDHLVMPVIDLDGVKDAAAMFIDARVKEFKGFVNCTQLEQASRMFNRCKALVGKIDILDSCSGLKQALSMFSSCSTRTPPAKCILPSLEVGNRMFQSSTNCCPRVLAKDTFKCDNLVEAKDMFQSSTVQTIKYLDLPVCTDCSDMFNSCNQMTTIEVVDAPEAIRATGMFNYCSQLKEVGRLNLPGATSIKRLFYSSDQLLRIGMLNIQNATSIDNAFDGCNNLVSIMVAKWNSRIQNSHHAFYKCNLGRKYGKNAEKLMAFLRSKVGAAIQGR